MKSEIIFRKAIRPDTLQLSVLYKQVYIHTYDSRGVTSESANYVTKQFSAEKIGNKIKENPDSTIVALYNKNPVGVAEIGFENICPIDNEIAPELCKLYVLESYCGTGVGYGLLKEAERTVSSKGKNVIWLTVYVHNLRAIKFYERNDYEYIGKTFFQIENNKYENKVFMKKLK